MKKVLFAIFASLFMGLERKMKSAGSRRSYTWFAFAEEVLM